MTVGGSIPPCGSTTLKGNAMAEDESEEFSLGITEEKPDCPELPSDMYGKVKEMILNGQFSFAPEAKKNLEELGLTEEEVIKMMLADLSKMDN